MAKKTNSKQMSGGTTGVQVGGDPRGTNENTTQWLKVDPNTFEDVILMVNTDEIISCEQCAIWLEGGSSPVWVYSGVDDPSHELKAEKRYRAFIPVIHKGDVKVWPMGKGAHGTLLDIADAAGELKGLEVRIKRTGSNLATRYAITPRGARHKVDSYPEVDIVSMLGPLDTDDVKKMIAEKLLCEDWAEVMKKYRGKSVKKVGAAQDSKAERVTHEKPKYPSHDPEEDEEVEDLDDIELV